MPNREMRQVAEFLELSTGDNPYYNRNMLREKTPAQITHGLFEKRKELLADGTQESMQALAKVEGALVLANLGLVFTQVGKAVSAVEDFFKDHANTTQYFSVNPVDAADAFSIGLLAMSKTMNTYDPDNEAGFFGYARLNISGTVIRYLQLPSVDGIPQNILSHIFFHYREAKVRVSKKIHDGQASWRDFDSLIIAFLCDIIPPGLRENYPGTNSAATLVIDAYHTLMRPIVSLDVIQEQKRRRISALAYNTSEVLIDPEGDIEAPSFIPVGNPWSFEGDPQQREEELLEMFDPPDSGWQTRMHAAVTDTGLQFTSQEWRVFKEMYRIVTDKTSPYYGAFPSYAEIGRRIGRKRERVRQIVKVIHERVERWTLGIPEKAIM